MQKRGRRQGRQQSVPISAEIELVSSSSKVGNSAKKQLPNRRKSEAAALDKLESLTAITPKTKGSKAPKRPPKPRVKILPDEVIQPPAPVADIVAVDNSPEKPVGYD